MCCCKVSQCCCCVDLKRGVQFMGIVFVVLYVIALIGTSVRLAGWKSALDECREIESTLASDVTHFSCFNNNVSHERKGLKDYLDWWDSYFGLVVVAAVFFDVIGLIVNGLLVMSTCNENRCLILPWLIAYMITIVFAGIALAAVLFLLLLATITVVVVWRVVLIALVAVALYGFGIYLWVCVYNLYKDLGEQHRGQVMVRPAAMPMGVGYPGGGQMDHANFPESATSSFEDGLYSNNKSRPISSASIPPPRDEPGSYGSQEEPFSRPNSNKLATVA